MTLPPHQPGDRPRLPATPDSTEQPPTEQVLSSPSSADPPPDVPAPDLPARSYVAGIVTAGIAAVCGAVFTSWAGVQGTLVGAMVGATIGSSVSEIVRAPLTSLEHRIIRAGVSARQLRRDGLVKTVLSSPTAARQVLGMVSRRSLVTVAAVALVGFAVGMSGITAVEATTGEPLAAIVADSSQTGTTIGHVLPDPPAVLAPAPGPAARSAETSAGQGSGGQTGAQPSDSVLGAEDRGVAGSPTPAETSTAADEADNAAGTASPVAGASPDASADAQNPMPDALATAAAEESAVQVVTVVVTATPTATAAASGGAVTPDGSVPRVPASTLPTPVATLVTPAPVSTPAQNAGPTPTPTPTSTPTPTRTPTSSPSAP